MQPTPGMRTGRTVTPRQIFFDKPEVAHYLPGGGYIDATHAYDGANTSYERELREGTIMARITASRQWCPCKRSAANGVGRAATALTVDDARAFKAGETVTIGGNQVFDIVRVEDDDSAASNGTAVYFHHDEVGDNPIGHLESTNANNADSNFTTQGGAIVEVEDDNAASTGGTQVYFDEDAATLDGRLMANFSDGKDHFVETSDGRLIRIAHNASASSAGVALYFDDNGATASQRLLFVSPTNADGYFHTDDVLFYGDAASRYVTRSTTVTISSIDYSTNIITLGAAATWADGDAVYCDSVAGSEIPRAILAEVVDLWDDLNRTYIDKYAGKLVDQGNLLYDNILGDIAACKNSPDTKLGQINFYDDGVLV